MDISAERDDEIWINLAVRIPSVPESPRRHYPFSRSRALVYRLKLSVLLLNAAGALCRAEDPCHRLALLLNFLLLFVMCEGVCENYPWREPLTVWMWKLYWATPHSRVLWFICTTLVLVILLYLESGCKLTHPLATVTVGWFCCMMIWPRIRKRWHREERCEDDYDQFSSTRSYALVLSYPFRTIFAALRSTSLLAFLAAFAAALVSARFLREWITAAWSTSMLCLAFGCFAVLCCHRLPDDVRHTLTTWEVEEASHARKIENYLRIVKGNLRTSGNPAEGSTRFDRLSVQVPLLLREAKILQNASKTITENRTNELEELTNAKELVEFHRMLEAYGPYTTECCVS